jgi:uncharacterized membrane protein YeaQ/YmgE (transglycosylase-associated protein family)
MDCPERILRSLALGLRSLNLVGRFWFPLRIHSCDLFDIKIARVIAKDRRPKTKALNIEDSPMTLLDLLLLLLIAGICGALGQAIAGYSRGGCLVSIALGFVGALLGLWLARLMQLPELFPVRIGATSFPIIWSIVGSALFVAVLALITRRRY